MSLHGCFQAVVLDAGVRLWKTPSHSIVQSTVCFQAICDFIWKK